MPAAAVSFFGVLVALLSLIAPASGAPPDPTSVGSPSELVLALDLDGDPVSDSLVAVERSGRLFLPICAVAEAVSIAIHCQEDRAFGFILDESRPLIVDLTERYAISSRSVFKIDDAAFLHGGDVVVDIAELSKWLPVDFYFIRESSSVRMHARELLPVQGFKKRQSMKRPAAAPVVPRQYRDLTPPRKVASVPTIDVTSQQQWAKEGDGTFRSTSLNSLGLSGDLLFMSSEAHLLAEDDVVKRLDITLSRRSDAGFRIGPVPITQLLLGASQTPIVDGIGAVAAPMYGALLSNRPLSGASTFLSHDIDGYLPAGWDAELFHNGAAIGYQPPTPIGMYHFQNLRLQYGVNEFKVILHGPFGETRELEQKIFSDATTPTGDFLYTLSTAWQTGLAHSDTTGPDRISNVTLTTDFGIAKRLTGSALFVRQTDNFGAEVSYAGLGIRTALGYTLLSVDLVQSFAPNGGHDGQMLTMKSSSRDVFGSAVEAEQRLFRDFTSLRFTESSDPLLSRTVVKCSSLLAEWHQLRFPLSMELGLDTRRSGRTEWNSIWRGSGGWYGWNGTLEADVSYLNKTVNAVGILQISTKVNDLSIRGQLGVVMAPDVTASVININADKELGQGLQLNSGFIHNPVGNISEFRVGVSKRMGLVGYTVFATGGTNGSYSLNAGVSTSGAADLFNRQAVVSAQPLSPGGIIAVSAPTLPSGAGVGTEVAEVGFLVNGNRAVTIPGTKGLPVLPFLQPDIPVDVSVDITTVEDPFMVPVQDGCRIVPRAGVVAACTLPMTTGGEIDGMVLGRVDGAADLPLKGVRVDLLGLEGKGDWKLQASTQSQESGYYLFRAIKPGRYRMAIPEAETARLKAAPVPPIPVTMPVGGDMLSGKDFLLVPRVPF